MEEILRKLMAVHEAAGDDWYDAKNDILGTLDVLLKIHENKFTATEMDLMLAGKKINAIKAYRDRVNVSLLEAKTLVEKWMFERQIPVS